MLTTLAFFTKRSKSSIHIVFIVVGVFRGIYYLLVLQANSSILRSCNRMTDAVWSLVEILVPDTFRVNF